MRREHKYGGDWIKTTNTGGYFSPGDVRSLEHAYLIDDEALDMAENAGVFLVPTTQATREDRAGLAEGTLADYTAADSLVWPTGRRDEHREAGCVPGIARQPRSAGEGRSGAGGASARRSRGALP